MKKIRKEEERKRFFALYGLFTGMATCLIFTVLEYLQHNMSSALHNLAEAVILFVIFLVSRRMKRKQILYVAGLISISLLLQFNVYGGAGGETSLIWSLAIPLIFAFYLGAKKGSIWLAVYTVLLVPSLFNLFPFLPFTHDTHYSFRFFIAYAIIASLSFSLEYSRYKYQLYQDQFNRELQEALNEIKVLQGIIPFCSYCQKIRDDRGYWDQVENYLARHADVLISHSICPSCLESHFPEEFESLNEKNAITGFRDKE